MPVSWRSEDRRWRTRSRARRSTRSGSRVNERGHLEVGGCDVVELAAEFGTPAYIYAEDDIRARARAYLAPSRAHRRRLRGPLREQGAAAAPRSTALFAEEGLSVDVASGGELHMALRGRLRPGAHPHARQQQDRRPSSATRSRRASAT